MRYARKRRLDCHYFRTIDQNCLAPSCYFCLRLLSPGQFLACSGECQKQLDLRSSSGLLRIEILHRDNFVCARCGVNGISLNKAMKILKKVNIQEYWRVAELLKIPAMRLTRNGVLLDVDHIIKVADGGGAGMEGDIRDNVQSLCLLCHHNKDNKPPKKGR